MDSDLSLHRAYLNPGERPTHSERTAMAEQNERETNEVSAEVNEKRTYEPPRVESVQLTREAAEALT